jgi:hypothetical protein
MERGGSILEGGSMSASLDKAMRGRLVWPILGVLLSVALVSALAACRHEASVPLEMSWNRGDNYYGPNFIHLESPCLSNPEPGCFCSLDFKTTTSKEFADYIESFGSKRVPVRLHVDYGRDGEVVGAILEGVGAWPVERFHINERSLATGFRMLRNQRAGGGRLNNPADCFPKPAK